MSAITQQNITQNFLTELSANSGKASFTPFDRIATALKTLEEKGLPNNRVEDYKYCNIESVIRKDFKSLSTKFTTPGKDETGSRLLNGAINIVVANGKLLAERSELSSLPTGLTIMSMQEAAEKKKEIFNSHFGAYAKEESDTLIALNTAYAADGLFVHVATGKQIEQPVHIIFIEGADETAALNTRNIIVIEKAAQLTLSEIHVSTKESRNFFSNSVTEVVIGEDAIVYHDLIQEKNHHNSSVQTLQVEQKNRSTYSVNTFTFDGALIRNNLNIVVKGERTNTFLNGITIAKDVANIDNHTLVDHVVPNCESSELYKGIATGKATLTFNGKIFVRRDAQKINAYQSSKNILLSDDATINTKPQLEIFANDVRCSHGTSTGKVDEDAMFYLKARGISEESARKLLLQAFAGEVVEKINNENLREVVQQKLERALQSL